MTRDFKAGRSWEPYSTACLLDIDTSFTWHHFTTKNCIIEIESSNCRARIAVGLNDMYIWNLEINIKMARRREVTILPIVDLMLTWGNWLILYMI